MTHTSTGGRRKKNYLWAWIIGLALLAVLFLALRQCGLGDTEPRTETVLPPTAPGAEATTATITPPTPPAQGVPAPQPAGPGEGPSPIQSTQADPAAAAPADASPTAAPNGR